MALTGSPYLLMPLHGISNGGHVPPHAHAHAQPLRLLLAVPLQPLHLLVLQLPLGLQVLVGQTQRRSPGRPGQSVREGLESLQVIKEQVNKEQVIKEQVRGQ